MFFRFYKIEKDKNFNPKMQNQRFMFKSAFEESYFVLDGRSLIFYEDNNEIDRIDNITNSDFNYCDDVPIIDTKFKDLYWVGSPWTINAVQVICFCLLNPNLERCRKYIKMFNGSKNFIIHDDSGCYIDRIQLDDGKSLKLYSNYSKIYNDIVIPDSYNKLTPELSDSLIQII